MLEGGSANARHLNSAAVPASIIARGRNGTRKISAAFVHLAVA